MVHIHVEQHYRYFIYVCIDMLCEQQSSQSSRKRAPSILRRRPSNRYEIDAISVSLSVWEVVAEMGSIRRNSLAAILENSDVIPHDLVISKAWPATVFLERIDRIINDDKHKQTSDG